MNHTHNNTIAKAKRLVAAVLMVALCMQDATPAFAITFDSAASDYFNTVDDFGLSSGSDNISVRFGTTLGEFLRFNRSADKFILSNDLDVRGTLSGSALTIMGGVSYLLGNVGIGTSATPDAKLEVVGNISGSSLKISGTAAISGALVLEGGSTLSGAALRGFGLLTDCDNAVTSKLLWDATTGRFSCGTDQTGAASLTLSDADARYVRKSGGTMTGSLVISNAQLNVSGSGTFAGNATDDVVLVVKGGASQTADIQQWKDSGNSLVANMTAAGNFAAATGQFSSTMTTENAVINGTTTLGTDASDTIAFGGQVNTEILPNANNSYNFGSDTNRWNNGYFYGLNVSADIYAGGNVNAYGLTATSVASCNAGSHLATDAGGVVYCEADGGGGGGMTYFNISDGTTAESVSSAETINFVDGTGIDVVVSATDTVTINSNNAYANDMNQNVGTDDGPTFDNVSTTGNAAFNGTVYLGSDASDTIMMNGLVNTSIFTDANNSHDLGNTTSRWAKAWLINLEATDVVTTSMNVTGNAILGTSNATDIDANGDFISDLNANANNTYNIGNSSNRWAAGWFNSLNTSADLSVLGMSSLTGNVGIGAANATSKAVLAVTGTISGATVYATRSFSGAGLSDCDTAGTSKLLWDATTGRFSCGTDTDTNTTYTAGQGLNLNGTSFRLNQTVTGSVIQALNSLASSGSLSWKGAGSGQALNAGGGSVSISASGSTFFNTGLKNMDFGIFGSKNNALFYVDATGSGVTAASSGAIGIGTRTPITQFHVAGVTPTKAQSSIATGTNPADIVVAGRYAYVTNTGGTDSLQIFDVSIPNTPVSVGSIAISGGDPYGVAVQGRYAYVANFSTANMQVYDVSKPSAPVLVGTVSVPGAVDLTVAGTYAYVLNQSTNKFHVIDISNPSSPVEVGSVTTDATPRNVVFFGRYAYITTSVSMQIIDVTIPSAPFVAGTVTTNNASAVGVQGRFAYVVSDISSTVQVIDIKNPASPSVFSTYNQGTAGFARAEPMGRYLYTLDSSTGRLIVIDITNPANITQIGSTKTNAAAGGLAIVGRYAYVTAVTGNTMQVFDLGGAYLQQLEAGAIETSNLSVRNEFHAVNGAFDGAVSASSFFVHGNGAFSGALKVMKGLTTGSGNIVFTSTGGVVFNEQSRAVDFRAEGDTDANLLFLDASVDRVGIGTVTPKSKFNVAGTISGITVYATQSFSGAGLTDCDTGATSKLLWDATTGRFSCGTDQTGAAGGGLDYATANAIFLKKSGGTMTGKLQLTNTMLAITGSGFITGYDGNDVVLTVKGNVGQSADLQRWTDSNDAVSANVSTTAFNINNNLSTNSNVTIGDNGSDTLTVNALVGSNINPSSNNTYSFGNSTNRWNTGWFANMNISGIMNVGGNTGFDETVILGSNNADSVMFNADVNSNFNADANNSYNIGNNTNRWNTGYFVNGNLSGDLALGGNTTIGDSNADNVAFNADVNTSFNPNANNTYDFGNSSFRWGAVWANSMNLSAGMTAQGTAAITGNVGIGAANSTSKAVLAVTGTISGATVYATKSFSGAGLVDCDTGATSKLLWDATTGRFSCGTDQTAGSSGGSYFAGQGLTLNGSTFRLNATVTGSTVKAVDTLASSGLILVENTNSGNSTELIIADSASSEASMVFDNSGTGHDKDADGLYFGAFGVNGFLVNRESGPLLLGTSGFAQMQFSSAGNVTIGDNVSYNSLVNPTVDAKLEVIGTVSGSSITQNSNTNNSFMGNVGIGTTTPGANLHIAGGLGTSARVEEVASAGRAAVNLYTAAGTIGAKTAVTSGRVFGSIEGSGYDGTQYVNSASIYLSASQMFNPGSSPSDIRFFNTATGSTTISERMRIAYTGNVGIGTTAPKAVLDVIGTVSGVTVYATKSFSGAGLTDCDTGATSKLLWDATTGRFSCGTDQNAGSSGGGMAYSTASGIFLKRSGGMMTGALVISKLAGLSGTKASLFSVDQMQLSQLEGGAFFGRTGLVESQLAIGSYGQSWTPKDSARSWTDVAMSSDGKFQTGTVNGSQIYVSSDYGNTWTAKDSSRVWYGVAMSSDGKVQAAVVYGGQIYESYDYGATWAAKDSARNWNEVAMSADGRYQTAVVDSGLIYISSDYGSTWTSKDSARSWISVAMSSDGRIQAAALATGRIYVSYDYGSTWTAVASNLSWSGIAMSADGKIMTATIPSGLLYVSTDYGATWASKASSRYWTDVAMSANGKVQAATTSFTDQIYVSLDFGSTWSPKEAGRSWQAIAMSSDGKIMTAANGSGLLYVSNATSYQFGNISIGTSTSLGKLTIAGASSGITLSMTGGSLSLTPGGTSRTMSGIDLGTNVNGVFVSGNFAFTVSDAVAGNELRAIDIANPNAPVIVGGFDTGQNTKSIYVSTRHLFVGMNGANAGSGMYILDNSDIGNPKVVSRINFGSAVNSIYVSGKYAYVGLNARSTGVCSAQYQNLAGCDFAIVDFTNATFPRVVGGLQLNATINQVYVQNRYAYLALDSVTGNDFRIIDLANPQDPTVLGGIDYSNNVKSVFASGRYAFIGLSTDAGTEFRIVDVSNKLSPTALAGLEQGSTVKSISVTGDWARLGLASVSGDDYAVIDLRTPSIPLKSGGADLGADVNAIAVGGKYAYVGTSTVSGNDMKIMDIAGIEAPAASIGSILAGSLFASDNVRFDNNAYVRNALNVGRGGIISKGSLSVQATGTGSSRGGTGTLINAFEVRNGTGQHLFSVSENGFVQAGTPSFSTGSTQIAMNFMSRRAGWCQPTSTALTTLWSNGLSTAAICAVNGTAVAWSGGSRMRLRFQGLNTASAMAGITTTFTETRSTYRPKAAFDIQTGTGTVGLRFYGGVVESSPAALALSVSAAATAIDYAAMAWEDGISGTQWLCCSGDGTNHSCTSMGVTVQPNTEYQGTVDWSQAGKVSCTLQAGNKTYITTKTTNVSTQNIALGITAVLVNKAINSATARVINVGKLYLEQN
jgi:hypothetical protein